MKLLRVKVGILTAAGAAMVMMLSGGTALASTQTAYGRTTTGPEAVYGAVYGWAANSHKPVIPVKLVGVVNTTGWILSGGRRLHIVPTKAGKLFVLDLGRPQIFQTQNWKSCYGTFTLRQRAAIVGGTGAFWHAYGPAAYQIYHGAYFPRSKWGKCWFRTRPLNKGAVLSFLGTAVLTVRI
jgi:hypothetical protein